MRFFLSKTFAGRILWSHTFCLQLFLRYHTFPFLGNRRKRYFYKAENLGKIMVLKSLKKTTPDKAEIKTEGLRMYYKKDRSPELSYSTGYEQQQNPPFSTCVDQHILLLILVYNPKFSQSKNNQFHSTACWGVLLEKLTSCGLDGCTLCWVSISQDCWV